MKKIRKWFVGTRTTAEGHEPRQRDTNHGREKYLKGFLSLKKI
jgi:hypothetical protein